MSTLIIYSVITGLVIWICKCFSNTFLENTINQQILHNMLHLDLINDLVSSNVYLQNQSLDHRSVHTPIRKSLLYFQMHDPSTLKGTNFIFFIEQWLIKAMNFQEGTFQFYAEQEVYKKEISSKTKYEISCWLETLLRNNPDFLDLSLSASRKSIRLKIKKLSKNNISMDLNTYLSNLAYDDLPGKLRISQEEYLIIEF